MLTKVLLAIIFYFFGFGIGTFICYAVDGKLNKETLSLSSIQNLTKERYNRNIETTIDTISQLIQYTAEHGRNSVMVLPYELQKFSKEDTEMILDYFKNKGFKVEEDKTFGSKFSIWYNISW